MSGSSGDDGTSTRRGCLWTVVTIGLLFFAAQIAPRLLIHSNVEGVYGVEGPSIQFAGEAYHLAHHGCTGPDAFICTAIRVIRVRHIDPDQSDGCRYGYTAELRRYTLFGIPDATLYADCNLQVAGSEEMRERAGF